MTITAVMAEVGRLGITIAAEGEYLRVRAPTGVVTPELREALAANKLDLMALLAPTEHVTLKGGLTIPLPALRLVWSLEDRGFEQTLDGQRRYRCEPAGALTDADRAGLARWADQLAAIVAYGHPVVA